MRNVKIFLGVAVISALFMKVGFGMEGEAARIAELARLRPNKPLPIPPRPEIKPESRPTNPLPIPPTKPTSPARPPVFEEKPATATKPTIGENPFDIPLSESESKAAAESKDNPFAEFTRKAMPLAAPAGVKPEESSETSVVKKPMTEEEKQAQFSKPLPKIPEAKPEAKPEEGGKPKATTPTTLEKIKQGAKALKEMVVGKPVEIGAPTGFKKLSQEEPAKKMQADIDAEKKAKAEASAQKAEKTAVQKQGRSLATQINKLTAKISGSEKPTDAEVKTISGAVKGFASAIREKFANASKPGRDLMSEQLRTIKTGLNKAIEKLSNDNPQKKELLTSKGEANAEYFQATADALLKSDPNSVAALADHAKAASDLLRSPASTKMARAKLEQALEENTKEIDKARAARKPKEEVEKLTKEHDDLATQHKALSDESLKKVIKETEAKIKENIKKQKAAKQKTTEAAAAEEALKPPAVRLKEAREAIKKIDKAIGKATETLGPVIRKGLTELERISEGAPASVKREITDFNSLIDKKVAALKDAIKKKASTKTMREVIDAAAKAVDKLKPISTKIDAAVEAVKKPVKELITSVRELIKKKNAHNTAATEARRDEAEAKVETADADYIEKSQKIAQEREAKNKEIMEKAQSVLGVKPGATNEEIAKAFRLAAIKANRIQDPTARDAAMKEISSAKLTLEKREANLMQGAGSTTGMETGDIKQPAGNPTKEETSKSQATSFAPSTLLLK